MTTRITQRSLWAVLNFMLILSLSITTSCSEKLPGVEGIDMTLWQRDTDACTGVRATTIEKLGGQKEKFLGLSEMDIVTIFGKPDQNELYKRNQKFYYYFLQPAPACPNASDGAQRLVFRFNAMGLAKEISIE
jgi:hypothetical protein